jgi:hypothetical protein
LAKIIKTILDEPIFAAPVDATFETCLELFTPIKPTINLMVGEAFMKSKTKVVLSFRTAFESFARQLSREISGPFFSRKTLFLRFFSLTLFFHL